MSRIPHIALAGALFFSTVPLYAQSPTPLPQSGAATRVLGPSGVRREAGNWLFNDSIFVVAGPNLAAPGSAPFLPSLRRNDKTKLPLFRTVATRGPLNYSTLPLPSLSEMNAPGYNFAALQGSLITQVNAARAQGAVYVGWALPTDTLAAGVPVSKEAAPALVKRLRTVLDAVAPDSALILSVDAADPLRAVTDIDAIAPSCDAVFLSANIWESKHLWPLKVARRVAEEQKAFDLPILVQPVSVPAEPRDWDDRLLEFFMGGATTFVLPIANNQPIAQALGMTQGIPTWVSPTPDSWGALVPAWEATTRRNVGLFAGAVTIEDAAILPTPNPHTLQIAADLRAAGRIPLAGRLPSDEKVGESVVMVLDDSTTLDTLSAIEKAARAGNAIYVEGVPDLKNKALVTKLSDMTSTDIEILPAAKTESLNLDDPWLFGSARGLELGVSQQVKWKIRTTLAGQTRIKKGEADQKPYAAAKLATDPNGLLVAPIGKGRLTWMPHTLTTTDSSPVRRAYYSAIAGSLQAALVQWNFASVEDEARNAGRLHVAMRASAASTLMVAVFNNADTDANITLSARSDAPIALDLLTDKSLPTTVSGFSSNLNLTVPARGYRWLAFGKTAKDLDKERLKPRPKARTK